MMDITVDKSRTIVSVSDGPVVHIVNFKGSTMLSSVVFTTNTLFFTFARGDVYRLDGAAIGDFERISTAESPGKCFIQFYRNLEPIKIA